ncbi:multicopper oxidase family protein [Aquisalibacillus elongatus]|uniref:Copper-containing nitrite reductase n=1 Tax=Aquisalibacillus elongatus TaxID=485577 RepID=A0A3N5C5K3_9BACI|nr:multicopper oxidase family protein [Aquisalibacillus elongatus]RPF53485.1 FtsP/CotA-like multicopper oxidase with cupredoxin domain [Aquisalibacillus elongatus]
MNKKIIGSILIILLLFLGYSSYHWIFNEGSDGTPQLVNGEINIEELYKNDFSDQNITEYNLTAEEVEWSLENGKKVNAWTYNGSVPGEPLRVTEGDILKVNLKNNLDVPVTIHWHGAILPNVMDGVPDLTQEAVQPGDTFTYQFEAKHPGTYWYHSHQHSALQVDKGLYGSLVVEERDQQNNYDREQILILDEWATDRNPESLTTMPGMMMGGMNGEADTKQMYDTYTVNGKSGTSIEPIMVKKGEKTLLRIINAGYQVQRLSFPKGTTKVVAYDAIKTLDKNNQASVIEVAPGERVDLEVSNHQSKPWFVSNLTSLEDGVNASIPVITNKNDNYENIEPNQAKEGSSIDGATLGNKNLIFEDTPNQVDVSYEMDLNMGMDMGDGMVFQINEQQFPNTPPIEVEEGDIVKVEINNNGRFNHPMHLHSHRFQVESKNDQKLNEPIVKDLINVKPGETFEIFFKADNKGEWLFHCHDNNHADLGMMTIVDYESVYSPFVE